mgnify:CR=1 FL=1
MKVIEVNLKSEDELLEKYSGKLSNELLKYLINESKYTDESLKIVIKTNMEADSVKDVIKSGLNSALKNAEYIDKLYNNKQILLFIMGITILIISTLILNQVIKEIVIIAGWVFIWEVIDISLNTDIETRITKRTVKKLLKSRIVVERL